MSNISKSDLEKFNKEGYLIVKEVGNPDLRLGFLKSVIVVLRHLLKKPNLLENCNSWGDPLLHQILFDFRSSDPTKFGAFYDTVQLSASLHQIHLQKEVVFIASQLLNTSVGGLSITGHMFRPDAPQDQRNTLDWHQDSSYYQQNFLGKNGLVITAPLTPVTLLNGGIKMLVGSHELGRVQANTSDKALYEASEQHAVDKQKFSNYNEITFEANPGDLLFFQMDMVHRSGVNQTESFRLTTGARFHKMVSDDHVPGRVNWRPNQRVIDELSKIYGS